MDKQGEKNKMPPPGERSPKEKSVVTSNAAAPDAPTDKVRLTRRNLTRDEATLLHEELKSTPNILGYTVGELRKFTDAIVAEARSGDEDGFVFAGACVSKDLLFGWTDIAALYVLPAFRGRRIGGLLYGAAVERAVDRGRRIYTLSRSPEIIRVMERHGLTVTTATWRAPFAVHWHMQWHMSSVYRWREAFRKSKMRRDDGLSFVAGTRQATKKTESARG